MASFELYGTPPPPPSTYTRIVALIAKERNIPYEFVPVNLLSGEQKQSAYLAHYPFVGAIHNRTSCAFPPSIMCCLTCVLSSPPFEQQDNGFELYESRAIGRYLATLGSGPELIPTEPKAPRKVRAGREHRACSV